MVHEHGGKGSGNFVDREKVINSFVKKDDIFLDVGCGPGNYLVAVSRLTRNITAIDIHEESIANVRRMGFNGIIADATKKIPLDDSSADSILISNVMHGFVEDKTEKDVLSEIRRVLRLGGMLGIVEFKENSLIGPPKNIRLSETVLREIFGKDFSKVDSMDVGPFNYLLVLKKDR